MNKIYVSRIHSLKYQAIMLSDGIIGHLYGPESGRRHEVDSGILEVFSESLDTDIGKYVIYGDPAYGTQEFLVSPFRSTTPGSMEAIFYSKMSECRVHVEYIFAKIVRLWAFIDFDKSQKLLLSRIGMQYPVAVFLSNLHTCCYG